MKFRFQPQKLFLKYSADLANFSLDILIKYFLIKEKECMLVYPDEDKWSSSGYAMPACTNLDSISRAMLFSS